MDEVVVAPARDHGGARGAIARARRIVVKIGSKSLSGDAWDRLAAEVRAARDEGRSVVIVSSGAIALGVQKLGLRARPKAMAWLQAAAAAGQSVLMQHYEEAFRKVGLVVAQRPARYGGARVGGNRDDVLRAAARRWSRRQHPDRALRRLRTRRGEKRLIGQKIRLRGGSVIDG